MNKPVLIFHVYNEFYTVGREGGHSDFVHMTRWVKENIGIEYDSPNVYQDDDPDGVFFTLNTLLMIGLWCKDDTQYLHFILRWGDVVDIQVNEPGSNIDWHIWGSD